MLLRTSRKQTFILIGGILLACFFYFLVGHLLFAGQKINAATLFYSRLLIWFQVIVLYVYAERVEKQKFLLWAEHPYKIGFYAASVAILYLLAIVVGVLSQSPKWFGWHESSRLMQMVNYVLNQNLALSIFTCLTAGFTEEFIFRGYLLPRLQLLFKNKYLPIFASAFVFGAIHYGYHSLVEVLFAFFIGLITAAYYQKYRNIKVLIITHTIIDLIAVNLSRFYHIKPH